ncbi:hypothetical protein Plhal304r1_c008g0030661 [Plasmopara halstedii]
MRWRELLVFGEASPLCAWRLSDCAKKKLFGPANTMKYCITWVYTSMPYMIWYLTR